MMEMEDQKTSPSTMTVMAVATRETGAMASAMGLVTGMDLVEEVTKAVETVEMMMMGRREWVTAEMEKTAEMARMGVTLVKGQMAAEEEVETTVEPLEDWPTTDSAMMAVIMTAPMTAMKVTAVIMETAMMD